MGLEDELSQIGSNLFALPTSKIEQLTKLFEMSRVGGQSDTVANTALAMLRPRLRIDRPQRIITPLRIFCRPFEDLLEDNKTGDKRRGKIARAAVPAIWAVVQSEADKNRLAQALDLVTAAVRPVPEDRIEDRRIDRAGPPFWAFCAEILDRMVIKAAAQRDYRANLIKQLGPEGYYEMIDVAGIMRIAEIVRRLTEVLAPKPLDVVTDDHLRAIKTAFMEVAQQEDGKPAYVAMVAIARLKDPFALTALSGDIGAIESGYGQENLDTFTRVTLAEDMGHYAEAITSTNNVEMSDRDIADLGRDYAQRLTRFQETITGDAARAARRTLDTAKAKLRDLVNDGVVSDADQVVVAGIMDEQTARRRADGVADNDVEDAQATKTQIAAEDRARALRKCLLFADDIGLRREVDAKIQTITREIEKSTNAAVNMMSGSSLMTAEGRSAAEAEVYSAVRMLELVAGPQSADKMRKKWIGQIADIAGPAT